MCSRVRSKCCLVLACSAFTFVRHLRFRCVVLPWALGCRGQTPKHEIFGPVLLSKYLSYSRSAYYALVAAYSAPSFAGVVYGRSP